VAAAIEMRAAEALETVLAPAAGNEAAAA